jgi:hypothetical protein
MAMGLIYTTYKKHFRRSYMSGFVGSTGCSNMSISGDVVEYDYLYPIYHIVVVLKHAFVVPNSNTYTLDWIIDANASQIYASGSPISAAIGVGFYPMTTEATWRIQLSSTFSPLETVKADLIPLAHYWRPLP